MADRPVVAECPSQLRFFMCAIKGLQCFSPLNPVPAFRASVPMTRCTHSLRHGQAISSSRSMSKSSALQGMNATPGWPAAFNSTLCTGYPRFSSVGMRKSQEAQQGGNIASGGNLSPGVSFQMTQCSSVVDDRDVSRGSCRQDGTPSSVAQSPHREEKSNACKGICGKTIPHLRSYSGNALYAREPSV
jgi:hypothetical protein